MPIKVYSAKDFPAYLPKLSLLYDDLFSGGKGFRAHLVSLVADRIGLKSQVGQLLAQTIEFIHNASLLHDDLIDQTPLRRGKSAAWTKYSPGYAVLAGDYLLARVMVNLSEHGNIKLVQYTAEMISDLLEGEWLQDSLVKDFGVELDELDRVHRLKTASLFKWCFRAPFIATQNEESDLHSHLDSAGELIGQLFQRSDDLLDFDVRNHEGKEVLTDLKSGYLNSFAAFCLSDAKTRKQLQSNSIQKLDQFYTLLGGQQAFQKKVNEFDEVNSELISLYQHYLDQAKKSQGFALANTNGKLFEDLEKLPKLLYWRSK